MIELTDDTWDTGLPLDRPALVCFNARWSGPCRILLARLQEIEPHFAQHLTFARVNVDDNPELCSRFTIVSVPTLLLLRQGRAFHERLVGLQPQEWLIRLLYRLIE